MELTQQLIIVAVVLGLPLVGLAFIRRRGMLPNGVGQRAVRNLELIERLALTSQHSIHLVRAQDRLIVVATHQGGVQLMDVQPPQAAAIAVAKGSRG